MARAKSKAELKRNKATRAAGRTAAKSAGKGYRTAAAKFGPRSPQALRAGGRLTAASKAATAGSSE